MYLIIGRSRDFGPGIADHSPHSRLCRVPGSDADRGTGRPVTPGPGLAMKRPACRLRSRDALPAAAADRAAMPDVHDDHRDALVIGAVDEAPAASADSRRAPAGSPGVATLPGLSCLSGSPGVAGRAPGVAGW